MKSAPLRLDTLTDDQLLARLAEVVGRTRRAEAELIWHLAEVDRRMLYRREACRSMHVCATTRLHLSDAEAYLRIAVARVSRRYPSVLSMLADGRLHLTAVSLLAPHLDDKGGEGLLARAVHRAPVSPHAKPFAAPTPPAAPVPPAPTRGTSVIAPTAADRYRVQFAAGPELHDQIRRAQALLRHQIPNGDLALVFERAMTLLIRELERVRFAATTSPRRSASEVDVAPSSRNIPAAIKRAVWKRDGEQCTFRDRSGRRCTARDRLEFHHITPFALGGDHSESNVTLRCSSHNSYQADLDFGADCMATRRRGPSKARCPRAEYGGVDAPAPGEEWADPVPRRCAYPRPSPRMGSSPATSPAAARTAQIGSS